MRYERYKVDFSYEDRRRALASYFCPYEVVYILVIIVLYGSTLLLLCIINYYIAKCIIM